MTQPSYLTSRAVNTIEAMEAAEPEKLESMPMLQLNKVCQAGTPTSHN